MLRDRGDFVDTDWSALESADDVNEPARVVEDSAVEGAEPLEV